MPESRPIVVRRSGAASLPGGAAFVAAVPGMHRCVALVRWLVDTIVRPLRRADLERMLLDPERIVRSAQRVTGLTELGAPAHPEGLAVACDSIRLEANLDSIGMAAVRGALVDAVSNRLRYVDALARVPQRFEVPLHRPLFIVGLPRSGTTLLHRLLCSVPGTRGIPLWEATRPIAGTRDLRRWRTGWKIGLVRAAAPGVMAKHAFELDAPEEAINLFEASGGWNPFLWRIAGCHDYVRWLLSQDATQPYACFFDLLRWMGAPTPDRRLVLKTPNHLGYLEQIHAQIPQAIFVRTHRDPARCIPSYASLSATMHGLTSRQVDRAAIGRTSLDIWCRHAAKADEARVPVIDVGFDELCRDPLGTVKRIHARARLPWSADVRAAVSAEAARRPAERFGRHEYSAEEYGLTDDGIRARYRRATLGGW